MSKKLSTVFTFKICHLKEFDDNITLHNLSMLLMLVVSLYLMYCSYLKSACRGVILYTQWCCRNFSPHVLDSCKACTVYHLHVYPTSLRTIPEAETKLRGKQKGWQFIFQHKICGHLIFYPSFAEISAKVAEPTLILVCFWEGVVKVTGESSTEIFVTKKESCVRQLNCTCVKRTSQSQLQLLRCHCYDTETSRYSSAINFHMRVP